MLIILPQPPIDGRAVSAQHGARLNDLSHERLDAGRRFRFNLLETNTAKAFRLQNLDGNDYDCLGRLSLRAFADGGVTAVANRKIALIDFDNAFQTLPTGSNHRPAEAMQNGPGGLIAAKAQHALQTQGAHPRFLARDMPCGSRPDLQGCACLIENRAGCDRTRMSAGATNQTSATAPVGFVLRCALRADEPVRPPHLLEITRAIVLGGKPFFKLAPRSRIVNAGCRRLLRVAHADIIAQVALSG